MEECPALWHIHDHRAVAGYLDAHIGAVLLWRVRVDEPFAVRRFADYVRERPHGNFGTIAPGAFRIELRIEVIPSLDMRIFRRDVPFVRMLAFVIDDELSFPPEALF